MSLIHFHKREKNIPYVTETPVIHESQGNHEDYFVSICGDSSNMYTFLVKDISSNNIFTILIQEDNICDWIIGEGSYGGPRARNPKYLRDELTFMAIGKIKDTNQAVYLEIYQQTKHNLKIDIDDKKVFSCLKMNKNNIIEVLDITIENMCSTFQKPNPVIYYTIGFYIYYRNNTFNNEKYSKFRDTILDREFVDFDNYNNDINLINFHKHESNSEYVTEIKVQGNKGEYFVNICGNKYNTYLFIVKDILSDKVFNIIIKEEFIEDWIISQCHSEYDDDKYDELTFLAIGKIDDTNKAVYLYVNQQTNYFKQLLMNDGDVIEVLDIIILNNNNNEKLTSINNLSKGEFYSSYRSNTNNNGRYIEFRDKILLSDFIDYDDYIENNYK